MLPWLMALAGVLSAKAGSSGAKNQLAGQIASRNAQRLGGNTDMLDAVSGRKAIASQEGQAIGSALTQSLVGQLGKNDAPAPPSDKELIDPWKGQGPVAPRPAMNTQGLFSQPYEQDDLLNPWGRR